MSHMNMEEEVKGGRWRGSVCEEAIGYRNERERVNERDRIPNVDSRKLFRGTHPNRYCECLGM